MPLFLIRGKLLVPDGELPMIFKAAILQMRSAYREYEENIKTIIRYMSEAKKNNADILLLPKCFITGYDLTITNDFALAEKDLEPLRAAAKELKIGLVAAALTKGRTATTNSTNIIDTNGATLMNY